MNTRSIATLAAARTRLPLAVIALGLTSFLNDLASDMIFPLLPVFLAGLGATPTFLGVVEGASDAVASLLKLLSGYAADRTRRTKPLVLLGYGLATIARPVMSIVTAPWQVLAVRLTDRVGKGLRTSPRDALIAALVPQSLSGRAFGLHRAMDHAGAVLGPLIATVCLASGVPLRTVFLLAIVPGVLSLVTLFFVHEPVVPRAPASPSMSAEIRLPNSVRAFFVVLAVSSLANSSDAFLLLRAHDLGVSAAWIPMLWSLLHVSKVVSSYVAGDLSDRVPRVRVIAAGWAVFVFSYGCLSVATQAWQAWAVFMVYGAHHGLTEPAEKALIRDLAPPGVHGRAFGYYNSIIGFSAIPAGYLIGLSWERFGGPTALAIAAGLAATSVALLFAWERAFPQVRDTSQVS